MQHQHHDSTARPDICAQCRRLVTVNAMEHAAQQRASWRTESDTYATLRTSTYEVPSATVTMLQRSFDSYPAGDSAERRIDDMIARGLLTFKEEAEALLELNAPHLFGHEPTYGPAPTQWTTPLPRDLDPDPDRHAETQSPGECDHRGGAICNAIGSHSFLHDGYADNAEAFIAGWNLAPEIDGQPVNLAPSSRALDYYTERPGPDRTAFTAGWIERQRARTNERNAAAVATFEKAHDYPQRIDSATEQCAHRETYSGSGTCYLCGEEMSDEPELCPTCQHPTDNHDRRAEDGDCFDCGPDGPCNAAATAAALDDAEQEPHPQPEWMPAHDFTPSDNAPRACRVCVAELMGRLWDNAERELDNVRDDGNAADALTAIASYQVATLSRYPMSALRDLLPSAIDDTDR